MNVAHSTSGFVTGYPKLTLRLEGLFLCIAALLAYSTLEYSWKTFFILVLLPDISFAGYLLGKKVGSIAYNIFHSSIGPIILGIISWFYGLSLEYITLIWLAHIGFDRFLGYGLKYAEGFRVTHLGLIGMWGKKHP